MCRFIIYRGPPLLIDHLITKPRNSLIHQSYAASESEVRLNGDGFGLAWYVPDIKPEPALFRSVTPAWSNYNLANVAGATKSACVLAHVRAASTGMPVAETNCHPFVHGPYSFMHNGSIGGFAHTRRLLRRSLSEAAYDVIQGSTDSEHAFALFLDQLWPLPQELPAEERLALALCQTIGRLQSLRAQSGHSEVSYLNFAVSDGHAIAACRFTDGDLRYGLSLHMHSGSYRFDGQRASMTAETSDRSVVIASEKLSDDQGWLTIPVNHFVVISPELRVRHGAIA
jgi:predicted glutamine amidotransferase